MHSGCGDGCAAHACMLTHVHLAACSLVASSIVACRRGCAHCMVYRYAIISLARAGTLTHRAGSAADVPPARQLTCRSRLHVRTVTPPTMPTRVICRRTRRSAAACALVVRTRASSTAATRAERGPKCSVHRRSVLWRRLYITCARQAAWAHVLGDSVFAARARASPVTLPAMPTRLRAAACAFLRRTRTTTRPEQLRNCSGRMCSTSAQQAGAVWARVVSDSAFVVRARARPEHRRSCSGRMCSTCARQAGVARARVLSNSASAAVRTPRVDAWQRPPKIAHVCTAGHILSAQARAGPERGRRSPRRPRTHSRRTQQFI